MNIKKTSIPLSKFPILSSVLRNTYSSVGSSSSSSNQTKRTPTTSCLLTGLLFAASWCPDCTDVVPQIGQWLSVEQQKTAALMDTIVYIPSDKTETSMQDFVPPSMSAMPFENIQDEVAAIKKYFQVCAHSELSALQMTSRLGGLPTLIVLQGEQVLTYDGIDQLDKLEQYVKP